MIKWKSLAGKFDPEEIEVIKQFQKKLNLNDYQFVRLSIAFMIFFVEYMTKLAESGVDEEINKELQQIKKEISISPELNAKVQPFLKKMEKFFSRIYGMEWNGIGMEYSVLFKFRNIGME